MDILQKLLLYAEFMANERDVSAVDVRIVIEYGGSVSIDYFEHPDLVPEVLKRWESLEELKEALK